MDTSTITGDASGAATVHEGVACTRLVVLADADHLARPSSYHSLDAIDEVRFRRGTRSVERQGRRLVIVLPDARMSSDHGRLVRHDDRWILDDPASKNGAVVDGALARRAVLVDGTLFELGRSFFLLRQSAVLGGLPDHLTADTDAASLPAWPDGMATFSPALARDFEALARLASSPVSIVLHGETGTGKEVLARAVHLLSRRTGELVAVNCGALPSALVEAELFGHLRGAFTNAVADRKGLVRSADGGTLFLDEIGELPAASQAALLRVLQDRKVVPVGADRPTAVDMRLITATLRDLEAAIADGRFRADLYARVAGHVFTLPPLRDRREDLGMLIARFLGEVTRIAPAALRVLLRYDWPHNIRELEQVLASALALVQRGEVELEHLAERLRRPRSTEVVQPLLPARELKQGDRELRERLLALLIEHKGNVVAVAQALGKKRTQIYKWIKRLGIDLDSYRR